MLVELVTFINAPPARVFDLKRSVELHLRSAVGTEERVVGGKSAGLLGVGDLVVWQGRHFGIRQTMAVQVTEIERPHYLSDRMISGAFKTFVHDHWFCKKERGTRMIDHISFSSPLGLLGRLVDNLILREYLTEFVRRRNLVLQAVAESDDWKRYLPRAEASDDSASVQVTYP